VVYEFDDNLLGVVLVMIVEIGKYCAKGGDERAWVYRASDILCKELLDDLSVLLGESAVTSVWGCYEVVAELWAVCQALDCSVEVACVSAVEQASHLLKGKSE